jgi:PAAR motif
MVGWLGVVSIGAVLLLRGAEGADDKRLPPVDSEMRTLSQKVAVLEARLRALEGVVQITGPNVRLVSSTGLNIHAATNISIQSSATVGISGGVVDIRGTTVMLGPGGKPIARMGDKVACPNGLGEIIAGSSTIFAQ